MNFDSEIQVNENEHAYNSEKRIHFKFRKRGHVSKQCRENLGCRRDSEDITLCFECNEFGHIAKFRQAKKLHD